MLISLMTNFDKKQLDRFVANFNHGMRQSKNDSNSDNSNGNTQGQDTQTQSSGNSASAPANGNSTDTKNTNPTGSNWDAPKKSDERAASAHTRKDKRDKSTRRRAGAKEELTDTINANRLAKKLEQEALAKKAAERKQPRSSPRSPGVHLSREPAPKSPKSSPPNTPTKPSLGIQALPSATVNNLAPKPSYIIVPAKPFLGAQALPTATTAEDKLNATEVKLERLPDELPVTNRRRKKKKQFPSEIEKRVTSARTSLRGLADFRARVLRKEYDSEKAWVPLAYQQHLFQACEALQPTDKRKKEEREIDTNEKAFKQLLEAHCLAPKEIFDLRNILRSSVTITANDTLEVVEMLVDKESKHDKNIEDLLKEIRSKRNEKLSIEKCTIFERRCNLRNHKQKNLMLLQEVPGQLELLKNTVSDCVQELEKYRDFGCEMNIKKFKNLAFDYSAAIRMLFTRIGKLLSRTKPFPKILLQSPEIMDLRILANTNAHDIIELLRGGGESESIRAKAIFQRLIADPTYLANIEALINNAIQKEKIKDKG